MAANQGCEGARKLGARGPTPALVEISPIRRQFPTTENRICWNENHAAQRDRRLATDNGANSKLIHFRLKHKFGLIYVDWSNIVQSIRELGKGFVVMRCLLPRFLSARSAFNRKAITSQRYLPFFFFLSQHFPSVERVCVPFAQPFEMQISRNDHLICIGRPYGRAGGVSSAALWAQWISARFP